MNEICNLQYCDAALVGDHLLGQTSKGFIVGNITDPKSCCPRRHYQNHEYGDRD